MENQIGLTPLIDSKGMAGQLTYGLLFLLRHANPYDHYLSMPEKNVHHKIRFYIGLSGSDFHVLSTIKSGDPKFGKDPEEQARILKKINEYLRHLSDHRWSDMRRKIKAAISTEIGRAINLMVKDFRSITNTLLVLEDLSDMSAEGAKRSRRGRFDLSVWARGELQDHLQEDLEWLYANVAYAIPEYSSKQCSKCEYVHDGNRNGKMFKCKRCGHTEDADINAAKNIRVRFSDTELQELARKYSWNKKLRRKKVLELLSQRANQAA